MVIRAIEARSRKTLHKPIEQRLVTHVHPERHLGLLAVASKRPLPDQQTDDDAALEVGEFAH